MQEERQRNIDGGIRSGLSHAPSEQPYVANASSSTYSRGRFLCTRCGKNTHTVDRCFYLHGFPPGFGRGRGKPGSKEFFQNKSMEISQPKSINCVDDGSFDDADDKSNITSTASPSVDQCQQLIVLLQSQLAAISTASTPATHHQQLSPFSSSQSVPFTGTILFSPFIAAISSQTLPWLLDTGATHHVCNDLSLFSSSSPVHNASVNLQNGNTAIVTHMGTITLSPSITLHSALCVPSFSYNLISVSSLTKSLSCIVVFTHYSF